MSEFGWFSVLERAAEVIDARGSDHAENDSISRADTIPAGGRPNETDEGARGDAMGPVCQLKNIDPFVIYPYEDAHNQYYAAKKAYDTAYEAQEEANDHLTTCLQRRDRLDSKARPLEFAVQQSKDRVERAKVSLLRVDEATQDCQHRLDVAHALYRLACSDLEEKEAALNKAEAGVGLYGKRQRSTASDDGIVASKSVKVGAESAGKAAARSGPVRDVSTPAVIEPDTALGKRLQTRRLAVEIAEKDVEDTKTKFTAVRAELKTLKEHPDGAARGRTRLEGLERAAANELNALKAFFDSLEYGKMWYDCFNARVKLAAAKAAAGRAQESLLEAEKRAFPHAFPEGGWEVEHNNKRVNRVVPPPTPYVPPPELKGVYRYSPSQAGRMLVDEEWRQAKEKSKKDKEKAIKEEKKGKEATKPKNPNEAAPAAGGATVRQSTRSSRGKPAEVYEA